MPNTRPIAVVPPLIDVHWVWRDDAACRDTGGDLFFHPDSERGPARRRRDAAAKAICATCPVIASCLDWALSVGEPFGIWGGLSTEDRAQLLALPAAAGL